MFVGVFAFVEILFYMSIKCPYAVENLNLFELMKKVLIDELGNRTWPTVR